MVIYNLSRCDRDAAICQSCSCWCSCCASGCSCFCSPCLRGCCAVAVVDVVGAVLCGASRHMLVCCVCCFVARTVLMSLWVHEVLTKWMQRPNTRQTGPPHSPTPSSPTPPCSRGGKTNIAKRTWKLICCSYCWVALDLCSLYFGLMLTMLGLCWVLLSCLGPMLGFVGFILGLCWDYVGFCWVVLGLCWPILGLCWACLGSILGHLGSVLAYLGDSWGYVAPSWDYVERRKDKVRKLYEYMFTSEFFTVFARFFTHSTF